METYVTETTKRNLTLGAIGISFMSGLIVSAIFFVGFNTAKADTDVLSQVRKSQSDIHNVAHDVGECLRHSIGKIDYIKAQVSGNGRKLDFMGE